MVKYKMFTELCEVMHTMKKMVIGGTYVYSGKGFSYSTVKKIRDGGIIDLGYSSWENDQQWIEVLEDNFFIGFINSKTKLIDLDNYCFVMEDNLLCYEKPDFSSEIKICLKRYDKVYLVSKIYNKGRLWLKIYDKHGFRCYIDANSYICPNKFTPYTATLGENTFMYIAPPGKGVIKTIHLKKRNRIYVRGLVPSLSSNSLINNNRITYIAQSDSLDNPALSKDVWMEIYARGLIGYIPAFTKTKDLPYIKQLPYEHFRQHSIFNAYSHQNKLSLSGLISIVLGVILFFIFPYFSIFAFYLWTLGICLFILNYFCS